jgi:hypothetical protein
MRIVHLGTGEKKRSGRRERVERVVRRWLPLAEPLLSHSRFGSTIFDRPVTEHATRNAGDKLLSEAFQYYIKQELGASSAPFLNCRKRFTSRHVQAINATSGLVVGGGGLFLYDTFPNLISDWQWGIDEAQLRDINVPLCVIAIGYNQFRLQRPFTKAFDRSVSALVERSAFFSLRHQGDIEKTKAHLPEYLHQKLKLHYCPTLTYNWRRFRCEAPLNTGRVGLCLAGDRLGHRHRDPVAFLKQMDVFRQTLESQFKQRVSLIFHSGADRWVLDYLKFDDIVDLSRLNSEQIFQTFTRFDWVVSDRGHGQMLPFSVGCKVLTPISHDKLKFFLEDVGFVDCGVEAESENLVERMLQIFETTDTASYKSRWRVAMKQVEENYLGHLQQVQTLLRHRLVTPTPRVRNAE